MTEPGRRRPAGGRARQRVARGRRVASPSRRRAARALLVTFAGALAIVALVTGVNAGARWLAKQQAARESSPSALAAKAQENLLIIGEGDTGAQFLAVRLDRAEDRVVGVAIPSGTFIEVPGQGVDRIGDSVAEGVGVSLTAISNFLGVPFEHYVTVSDVVYRDAVTNQSLRDVMANITGTDLSEAEQASVAAFIDSVPGERTALVPLPLLPVTIGEKTLYEPQRDRIADLLYQWWGIKFGAETEAVSVIVYNGYGEPGIAGEAAKQLTAAGFRVVDTGNADRFDYATTLIVVQNGNIDDGELVRTALGTGEVVDEPSEQDITDVIVIIGRDYADLAPES